MPPNAAAYVPTISGDFAILCIGEKFAVYFNNKPFTVLGDKYSWALSILTDALREQSKGRLPNTKLFE